MIIFAIFINILARLFETTKWICESDLNEFGCYKFLTSFNTTMDMVKERFFNSKLARFM